MNGDAYWEIFMRVKALETANRELTERVDKLEALIAEAGDETTKKQIEVTETMMDSCYRYGKQAYKDDNLKINDLAEKVSAETGMNVSSAIITITAVKNMLSRKIYKRGIKLEAIERYFSFIHHDYGMEGVKNAYEATLQYMKYREEHKLSVKSLKKLCEKLKKQYDLK